MLDETLGFFVKATGEDESLMRRQFTRMKLESLPKERDHCRTRAEAKQRLQDKKEEAWELFQRQPRLGAARREEFEREYKQKAQKVLTFWFFPCGRKGSASVGGGSAQSRSGARLKEGSQRVAEHGAGGFQLPKTSSMGEDMGSVSPRAVSCSWKLSRDVRLDVELTALVS